MEEAGKTLSRVHEGKEGRRRMAKDTLESLRRRDRGGWTEGWLAVSE